MWTSITCANKTKNYYAGQTPLRVSWVYFFIIWLTPKLLLIWTMSPLVGLVEFDKLILLIWRCIIFFWFCCNVFAVLVCSILIRFHPCWLFRLEENVLHAVVSCLSCSRIVNCTVTDCPADTVIHGCCSNTAHVSSYGEVYWSSILCSSYYNVILVLWSPSLKTLHEIMFQTSVLWWSVRVDVLILSLI